MPRWTGVATGVAVAHVLIGALAPFLALADSASSGGASAGILVAISVTNAGVAAVLFLGGRSDPRALLLATAFLLVASAFSQGPMARVAAAFPPGAALIRAVASVQVEVFVPYFLWEFARDFPSISRFSWSRRAAVWASRAALWTGVLLLSTGILVHWRGGPDAAGFFAVFARSGAAYWPLILGLTLGSFVYAIAQSRHAKVGEQRRVIWFLIGFGVAFAPVLIVNGLTWLLPAFRQWLSEPEGFRIVAAVAYPIILVGPLITAYAVLVHRALDVRLVVRKALQYALARYSLGVLVLVPFVLFLAVLYRNRNLTVADLLTGPPALVLLATMLLGLAAIATRPQLLRGLDAVFFREQYDSHQILSGLVNRSREVPDVTSLANLLVGEVDRALHPSAASFLMHDTAEGLFIPVAGHARPLENGSELVRLLERRREPLSVDLERSGTGVDALPRTDAVWLGDCGFRLLVPIISAEGQVSAMLGLAEKRSELPYSGEDQALLGAIAASASLAIENRTLRAERHPSIHVAQFAGECDLCGLLDRREVRTCRRCSAPLERSPVPLMLAGKYQLVERIGRGGMGVVYRGLDLPLDRPVAVKTLPQMSPRHSQRLRREARAIASVSHPNLALIFAAESWHGTPILVLEYLPGGTLSDRLAKGPMPLTEARTLALTLADVADRMHERGILHRDIKPSNIGYTDGGTPKLMDFGVARILEASGERHQRVPTTLLVKARESRGWIPDDDTDVSETITRSGQVVGTPLYLSPEAIDGREPEPGFDLWAIGIVFYEALTGHNPMDAASNYLTYLKVLEGDVPDIREYLPHAPPALASFFRDVLAKDRRHRPSTGAELRARIAALGAL